jgi:hypothetical protein
LPVSWTLGQIPAPHFLEDQSPIIAGMDLEAIVQDIDAEVRRLEKIRALLTGHTAPLKRGMPDRKRKPMSAEGRARVAAAQRKRWANQKDKMAIAHD